MSVGSKLTINVNSTHYNWQ